MDEQEGFDEKMPNHLVAVTGSAVLGPEGFVFSLF